MEVVTGIYKINSKARPDKIYIGSAVDYNARRKGHIYTLKLNRHKNPKLQAHFNKYGIKDLEFVFLENVMLKDKLLEREQFYIDALNPWFNICKVAGSSLGVKRTEEYKTQMSLSKKGKHHRPECFVRKSQIMKGQQRSLGYKHTIEARERISRNNPRKRRILQYDLDGNFIKEWESTKQVVTALGLCSVSINACCSGKMQTSGGYRWIQALSPGQRLSIEDIKKLGRTHKRKLMQYDLKGNLIKEWPSLREASIANGILESAICQCCRGNTKTSGGFIWKYKNQ